MRPLTKFAFVSVLAGLVACSPLLAFVVARLFAGLVVDFREAQTRRRWPYPVLNFEDLTLPNCSPLPRGTWTSAPRRRTRRASLWALEEGKGYGNAAERVGPAFLDLDAGDIAISKAYVKLDIEPLLVNSPPSQHNLALEALRPLLSPPVPAPIMPEPPQVDLPIKVTVASKAQIPALMAQSTVPAPPVRSRPPPRRVRYIKDEHGKRVPEFSRAGARAMIAQRLKEEADDRLRRCFREAVDEFDVDFEDTSYDSEPDFDDSPAPCLRPGAGDVLNGLVSSLGDLRIDSTTASSPQQHVFVAAPLPATQITTTICPATFFWPDLKRDDVTRSEPSGQPTISQDTLVDDDSTTLLETGEVSRGSVRPASPVLESGAQAPLKPELPTPTPMEPVTPATESEDPAPLTPPCEDKEKVIKRVHFEQPASGEAPKPEPTALVVASSDIPATRSEVEHSAASRNSSPSVRATSLPSPVLSAAPAIQHGGDMVEACCVQAPASQLSVPECTRGLDLGAPAPPQTAQVDTSMADSYLRPTPIDQASREDVPMIENAPVIFSSAPPPGFSSPAMSTLPQEMDLDTSTPSASSPQPEDDYMDVPGPDSADTQESMEDIEWDDEERGLLFGAVSDDDEMDDAGSVSSYQVSHSEDENNMDYEKTGTEVIHSDPYFQPSTDGAQSIANQGSNDSTPAAPPSGSDFVAGIQQYSTQLAAPALPSGSVVASGVQQHTTPFSASAVLAGSVLSSGTQPNPTPFFGLGLPSGTSDVSTPLPGLSVASANSPSAASVFGQTSMAASFLGASAQNSSPVVPPLAEQPATGVPRQEDEFNDIYDDSTPATEVKRSVSPLQLPPTAAPAQQDETPASAAPPMHDEPDSSAPPQNQDLSDPAPSNNLKRSRDDAFEQGNPVVLPPVLLTIAEVLWTREDSGPSIPGLPVVSDKPESKGRYVAHAALDEIKTEFDHAYPFPIAVRANKAGLPTAPLGHGRIGLNVERLTTSNYRLFQDPCDDYIAREHHWMSQEHRDDLQRKIVREFEEAIREKAYSGEYGICFMTVIKGYVEALRDMEEGLSHDRLAASATAALDIIESLPPGQESAWMTDDDCWDVLQAVKPDTVRYPHDVAPSGFSCLKLACTPFAWHMIFYAIKLWHVSANLDDPDFEREDQAAACEVAGCMLEELIKLPDRAQQQQDADERYENGEDSEDDEEEESESEDEDMVHSDSDSDE